MTGPTLQDGIDDAGSAVALLWRQDPPVWAPPVVQPEYSGWRIEQHAWHEAVTIADLSFHMWDTFIEGPDALRLLSELSANDYRTFAIGQAKQFLPVTEEGLLVIDGILTRDAADRFTLSGVPPAHSWVRYHAERGDYDVEVRTDPSMEFRSGQAGWEFMGDFRDHEAVKDALLTAGEPLGLEHIGAVSYPTGGVESGWIACPLPAIYTAPELTDYRQWVPLQSYEGRNPLHGGWCAERIEDYYVSPYELGYGRFVSFEHDFVGRDALRERSRDLRRTKVSLLWDDDAVQTLGGEPNPYTLGIFRVETSQGQIGATAATAYLDPIGAYLSLAVVDVAHATPGTRVEVVVGLHPGPDASESERAAAEAGFVRVAATVHPVPFDDYARTAYRSTTG